MQTFMPYPDYERSAACLDNHRLGKQRVETLEILVILSGEHPSWMSHEWYARCESHKNHPAVKMWDGYHGSLVEYGLCVCTEWRRRGYEENLARRIAEYRVAPHIRHLPWWFGREEFHRSHRSNLLYKDEKYYSQFGWTDGSNWLYWWPSEHEQRV